MKSLEQKMEHGIFGSHDLDQSGMISAKLQSMLVVLLLVSFTKSERKQEKTKNLLKKTFLMDDEVAENFMTCFSTQHFHYEIWAGTQ